MSVEQRALAEERLNRFTAITLIGLKSLRAGTPRQDLANLLVDELMTCSQRELIDLVVEASSRLAVVVDDYLLHGTAFEAAPDVVAEAERYAAQVEADEPPC